MRQTVRWAATAALVAAGLGMSGGAQAASFTPLGDLPGDAFFSTGQAISADGNVVVGPSSSASGGEAFRWTAAGGIKGLGDLPGGPFNSYALGVSGDGRVVVGQSQSRASSPNRGEAFRWTEAGGIVGLGNLAGGDFSSLANATSADGTVVVGHSSGPLGDQAARWTEATGWVGLGDTAGYSAAFGVSADGSVVVGGRSLAGGGEAFRWTAADGMVGLGFGSTALDVSADGSVVVGVAYAGQASLWTEATGWVGLGDLPGGPSSGYALGVSADGSVVVGNSSVVSGAEAFLWTASAGMRRLADVLVGDYGLDLTGWTLVDAMDVSDDGLRIVGEGINPAGDHEAFLVRLDRPHVVPLPAPLWLLGAGFLSYLGLGWSRRSVSVSQ